MKTAPLRISEELVSLGLERYVRELESDGMTVVPPEVTGFDADAVAQCTRALLDRFEALTGCPITVEGGPQGELVWPDSGRQSLLQETDAPEPTQVIIQQLLLLDRCFRDLFCNPVIDALVDYLMGRQPHGASARRLSSANSFVKWQGEYGYGKHLGLHCDQGANPLPWGRTALTANATWCLTDYTKEDGALAYVPGSHRSNGNPVQPEAAAQAIAAEAPKGSCLLFPGTTWHGAFPKQTTGLRLCAVAYYRHHSVLPQENLRVTMAGQPWDDCIDPALMRELIGFDDVFPYLEQSQPMPKLASSS